MKKIAGENIYLILSTEAFPSSVPVGSICLSVNLATNKVRKYITSDNGANWAEIPTNDYTYVATGGTKTTIVDTSKDFTADMLKDTTVEVTIGDKTYFRVVSGNTADTITIALLVDAVAAGASIGATDEIDIVCAATGIEGNGYTVNVVVATGESQSLSAAFEDDVLTVSLATNAEGAADDTANTADLVTAAIDALDEFTATCTGTAVVPVTATPVAFTGGIDEVKVSAGCSYRIRPTITNKALT